MAKDETILVSKFRWFLLTPIDRVLVAVSGGPDSLCLLHVLWTKREKRQLGDVEAAHLDHGLRGAESAAEADWVAAWCAERGITCHVGRVDLGAKRGQEAARAVRYEFLERTAAQIGANKIVTGHTRDDQVETVLANILRGTGLAGLGGIPEQREWTGTRGKIVRPLLGVTRAEVEAYNRMHGLSPRQDPSNQSAEHYTRNRIRLELLPELRRDYNARVDDALLRLSEIAARDSDYLDAQAQAALIAVTRESHVFRVELDRVALTALHPALLRRVLRLAIASLRGTGEGISYEMLESSCMAITVSSGTWAKSGTEFALTLPQPACSVRVTRLVVVLTTRDDNLSHRLDDVLVPLTVPGTASLAGVGQVVWASWQDAGNAVGIDADAVDVSSLHVRNRRTGDRIDPLGMSGRHKKVSDIFTDAKVPKSERDRIPIVADANGILWVAGFTLSERVKVTSSTARRLFLSAQRTKPAEMPAGNGSASME